MKTIFTTILALATTIAFAQFSNHTVDINGTGRQYRQYLPSGLNTQTESVPLVIAMHGIGDDMQNFSNVGFSWFADTARFICVFPEGEPNSFGQNSWNNGTILLSTAEDDIGLLNKIIDDMHTNYNIDLSRVYVCGFSMGGIMTHRVACALPYRVAAIASVSGTMSDVDVNNCEPGRAVPVMHMHGTADATVPYSGAALPSLSLVQPTIDFWKENNNCTDSTVTPQADIEADGITVDKIAYTGGGAETNLWKENGADHQWLYYPINDIDATIEIWLFFRNKVHPNVAGVGIKEESASNLTVFAAGNELHISSDKNVQLVEVYDMQGKLLAKTATIKNVTKTTIALQPQSNQMVLVKAMVNGKWTVKRVALLN